MRSLTWTGSQAPLSSRTDLSNVRHFMHCAQREKLLVTQRLDYNQPSLRALDASGTTKEYGVTHAEKLYNILNRRGGSIPFSRLPV